MAFTLPSRKAAEKRAADLNAVAHTYPADVEFRAAIYPDGQRPRKAWLWGVARHQLNYGKNGEERSGGVARHQLNYGKNGEERFLGFVWF